jgi:HEAT repeat protein
VTTCRESYIHAPSADRPKKLLALLGDELPELRALGLEFINALITDRKEVSQEVKNRLVEMVEDHDASLRQKAAQMVGDLRLTEAVPKLLEVLSREPDYRARASEVNAVGRLDGLTALPALLTCLADDAGPVVSEAALALADLSRRLPDDPETAASITEALLARFKLIPNEDASLREKFLEAMSRAGADLFRPVFRQELAPVRPVNTRRAAIIGLGAYGDAPAAEEIRPLLTAPEAEIRLAAAQAMGPCGRTPADLQALSSRLDGTSEADPAVRERAWDSYLQTALRLPPTEWLAVSDGLARPGDVVSQRRRVELLKAVTGVPQKLKQLPEQGQIGVFERLGDAQAELGDNPAAASSYEQALALVPERSASKAASLTARLVVALIRARQDRAAVQRVADCLNVVRSNDDRAVADAMAQAILREVRARRDAAGDAPSFGDALKLIDLLVDQSAGLMRDFEQLLGAERAEVLSRQSAAIDRLLDVIGSDPQAAAKLTAYGKPTVLPKVIARLSARTSSAPASAASGENAEEKLIELARLLAEPWPGYVPGCPAEERSAALERLKDLSKPVSQTSKPASDNLPEG